ncbi:MAG: rhomboid family intramembrane serine protease [Thermoguttaceae bacterium]|nr:rhomboid family intramembrane serine protease [Thermoguttaceae bacterium]
MHEFKVKFVKGQGEQGKLLKGAGTIAISDDEVVLTRSEIRGWFGKTPAETVTVDLNHIANVGENEALKCLQLCEYKYGKFSGTPANVYQFSMVDKSEKSDLLELLPKQVSEEVALETEFHDQLKQLTPYAFFTIAIVIICVLVYIAMGVFDGFAACIEPTLITLLRFGADYGPLVAAGEWFRIITSAFVHIGFIHILFNMVILWQIGHVVERLYGNLLFLVVYLGSAVAGSLMSLTMNPLVISAGASGAIFGLFGALLAYMLRRHGAIPKHMVRRIRNDAIAFVVFNLIYGMQAGIDNWCHLGGLLGGFFLGVIVAPPFESEERTRQCAIMTILGAAIIVAGSNVCLSSNPTKLDQESIGSALTELGVCYFNGNSELKVERDVNAAIGFFNKAIQFNNPVAIYNLAFCYLNGIGVEQSDEKALELLKKGAELGDAASQCDYARLLLYKMENQKEGLEWLKKACENGSQSARCEYAILSFKGEEGVEQNQEFAIKEFKELAELKFRPAIEILKELEGDDASETPDSEDEPAQEDEPAPVEGVEQEED